MAGPVVDPAQPIDYASSETPSSYSCQGCQKAGVKLWREYNLMVSQLSLRCADCASRNQGKDISTMDEKGRYMDDLVGRTDKIGWLVPAIPTEENDTFWGYTAVPRAGCDWWGRLPVR